MNITVVLVFNGELLSCHNQGENQAIFMCICAYSRSSWITGIAEDRCYLVMFIGLACAPDRLVKWLQVLTSCGTGRGI